MLEDGIREAAKHEIDLVGIERQEKITVTLPKSLQCANEHSLMALSDLPLASGQTHKKVFQKLGWSVRREGNHIVMTNPNVPRVTLSIPNHSQVRTAASKAPDPASR